MQRATFARVKTSRIPEFLNIGPTDSRLLEFVNEACERLLPRGKYWNTYARYAVAASSQLFSPPPYIDTVERANVATSPIPVHDLLYQFLDNGWGSRDDTLPNGSGVNELLHRGNYPTMIDIPSPGSTITAKCDVAADVGQPVLLLGYDSATPPNWVRTQVGGVWQDGEIVLFSQGLGTSSVTVFSKLTNVQIGTLGTPLSGQSWLYAGSVATGTLLSNYQWFEQTPLYPRYLIPFVNSTITTVEIIGKLAFIPVVKDTDYLPIGNLAAVKLACRAIKAEEEDDWGVANLLWNGGTDPKTKLKVIGAIQELDFELDHYLGSGRQIGINMTGSGYGNDMVEPIY
jgi:hypothetical protein